MAAMASALVILPLGPVAAMAFGSRLFSATTRWTAGDRVSFLPPEPWAEPVWAGAAAGAGAAAAGAEAAAPEPETEPIFWPGVTVAPSSAAMVRTPSAGADTSTATLSVSISTSSSSFLTASPLFFSHLPIEPSATLSPITGTVMSMPDAAAAGGALAPALAALAGAGGGAPARAGPAAAAAPPSVTEPRTVPGTTVSPSAALMAPRTPSAGATTSSETLSVSSSTSSSSFLTASPTFLVHFAMVASVTDSPRAGVRMSAMSGPAVSLGVFGEVYQAKASLVKVSSSFRWRLIRPAAVEAEPGRPT